MNALEKLGYKKTERGEYMKGDLWCHETIKVDDGIVKKYWHNVDNGGNSHLSIPEVFAVTELLKNNEF